MNAETAYVFRHALLRDAAYQLQLPGDRARLHRLAFALIEDLAGGRSPEPPPLGATEPAAFVPHASDPFARELADHARLSGEGAGGRERCAARRHYLRRAAEDLERRFQDHDALRLWEQLAELLEDREKGESLRRAGIASFRSGHPDSAGVLYARALAIFKQVGDPFLQCLALESLAGVERATGRVKEAERLHEEALELVREVGNDRLEGVVLGNLGILLKETGRLGEAERTYSQALTLHRRAGDRRCEGTTLANLALVYLDSGRSREAEKAFGEALKLNREIGYRNMEGTVLSNRGLFYSELNRLVEAERDLEAALAIHREVRDRRSEGSTLASIAGLLHRRGREAEATRLYEQAISIHKELGNRRSEGIATGNLAKLLGQMSHSAAAERLFRRALDLHLQVGNRGSRGETLCSQALFLLSTVRVAEARATWLEGSRILRDLGLEPVLNATTREMRSLCEACGAPPLDAGDQD